MSEVRVNKLSPRSGTTVTIGDSGDTINIVGTLQNNGSALTGDISSVVAGTGLSGGGTSGDVTLNVEAAQSGITSLGTLTALNVAGNATITTTDNSDTLKLVSTDADASRGPVLVLHRDSGSPADNDVVGELQFSADSDAASETNFALLIGTALDVSHGSESGELDIQTRISGTGRSRIKMNSTETIINDDSVNLDFRVESDNSTNALFVDGGNGNVCVGSSVPSGTSSSSYKQLFVNTGGALVDSGGGGPATMLLNNSYIGSGNNNFATQTAKASRINLTSGRVDFATAASHSADAQQTFTERMRIHDNGVVAVNDGIALGVGILNTSSNVLDDYEEGTWTPTIKISGSTTGITYSVQAGHYTKIGNRVIASAEIALSAKGSNTGNVSMIGLPFTTSNDNYQTATVYNDRVSSPNGDVQAYVLTNGTSINFYQSRTDGTNNGNLTGNEMNATSYLIMFMTYKTG